MRDVIVLSIVLWGLSKVFARPYVGVYLWTWLSLMNPHRLAWGFAYSMPFAQIVALSTIIGLFTGKEKKQNIWSPISILLLVHLLWMCVTTYFAVNPGGALYELNRFWKIQLFTFLALALLSDREKVHGFIWVVVLSIGYYGVKGGVFTVLTGGSSRVWGPVGSFIEGNNEMALAMITIIPLMRYLQLHTSNKWIARGLLAGMLLTAISVLGSQSRGAFLGIIGMGLFFWFKSPNKLGGLVLVSAVSLVIVFFMPESWWDRMNTVKTYDEDASAMGRINAWWVAFHMANASITGGGANMFTPAMFALYAPIPEDFHDVHSIYFEQIGEQGWIGFSIFMAFSVLTWIKCGEIIKRTRGGSDSKWASDLAAMLQASLIGFWVAGAFLGMSYFDLYYDLIVAAIVAGKVVDRGIKEGANKNAEARALQ